MDRPTGDRPTGNFGRIEAEIIHVREDVKEIKDLLGKLDERYILRREIAILKWAVGIAIMLSGLTWVGNMFGG